MFSSWDLVRPRFWYPLSSLEQSMMELEQISDRMTRPRISLAMHREALAGPTDVEDSDDSDSDSNDDDQFFVDLPVVARKHKPTALQLLEIVPETTEEYADEVGRKSTNVNFEGKGNPDTDSSTDMEVDDKDCEKKNKREAKNSSKTAKFTKASTPQPETKTSTRSNKSKKHNKKLHNHSYKVSPTAELKVSHKPKPNAECRTYSSYSFSNCSVVDDKGRRVTTTRRRYEDSTGRLKAMHEREIDGKKLRMTWGRQSKDDEGQHESVCSSGSPEEFEVLWQQTPFGEEQKKMVKADLEKEVASAPEDTAMEKGKPRDKSLTKKIKKVATKEAKKASAKRDKDKSNDADEEKQES